MWCNNILNKDVATVIPDRLCLRGGTSENRLPLNTLPTWEVTAVPQSQACGNHARVTTKVTFFGCWLNGRYQTVAWVRRSTGFMIDKTVIPGNLFRKLERDDIYAEKGKPIRKRTQQVVTRVACSAWVMSNACEMHSDRLIPLPHRSGLLRNVVDSRGLWQ